MRNTLGTPNPSFYSLGRGSVSFGTPLDAVTGKPANYRHLGNASDLSVNVSAETLQHLSSRSGLKVVDLDVVVSQSMEVSLVLDEIAFENLALFMAGTDETLVAATYNPTALATGYGFNPGAAWVGGRWYDLLHNAAPGTASGRKGYDLKTSSPISFSAGTPAETTDYVLDRKMGRIFIVKAGALDGATSTITVAQNASAAALDVVKALKTAAISGALKFIGKNPANNDQQVEYQFHKVSLKADGELPLIGSEFMTLSLKGVAEANALADSESPTLRVTSHVNAHA